MTSEVPSAVDADCHAIVLFSGGQDSTTCLAWALDRFAKVDTFGVDYRQRHRVEMDVRGDILAAFRDSFPAWAMRMGDDYVADLEALGRLSETALTRQTDITFGAKGLPSTFVPGRNLIFLTFASAFAYRADARHIVTGVCETDYSGYPDCRDDAIKALQVTLNIGMESRFVLHTPLMWRDKAATWLLAEHLGGPRLVEIIREKTHTCYMGDRTNQHDWGFGCGDCPACDLRRKGYQSFVARDVA